MKEYVPNILKIFLDSEVEKILYGLGYIGATNASLLGVRWTNLQLKKRFKERWCSSKSFLQGLTISKTGISLILSSN
ncbi:hypothetical protein HanXRQr2_Chr12g0532451 [Helianthus annuus]|uniref:Uncharacterized protein n=1 Tax=Helianthus annuus TaxID=4232 RepID=A0A9K3HF37_HELAN|nr:hypothetical protein HanXRQr2_Chr12g0532451 [Helianthus annuus]